MAAPTDDTAHAAAQSFLEAIFEDDDTVAMWDLMAPSLRAHAVRTFLWLNRDHPLIAAKDINEIAEECLNGEDEGWRLAAASWAGCLRATWPAFDFDRWNQADGQRPTAPDLEEILWIDELEHPRGPVAEDTPVEHAIRLLLEHQDGRWLLRSPWGEDLQPEWPDGYFA